MKRQLALLDADALPAPGPSEVASATASVRPHDPPIAWRLDDATRRRGLRGVAEARQILRDARRPAGAPSSRPAPAQPSATRTPAASEPAA